jgi:hypothetical protein
MICVIDPARKDEVIEPAAAFLQAGNYATASGRKQLELHGPICLLSNDDCM